MTELTRTRQLIEELKAEKHKAIDAIYAPSRCSTAGELKALMETEFSELFSLQNDIITEARKTCIRGMEEDGVPYPSLVWACRTGEKYTSFSFPMIKDDALRVAELSRDAQREKQTPPASSSAAPGQAEGHGYGRTAGIAAAAAGGVTVILGIAIPSLRALLLSLGIVMTAVGAIVIIRSVTGNETNRRDPVPAAAMSDRSEKDGWEIDESETVRQVLAEQRKRCGSVLDAYCDRAYQLACEAWEAEHAGAGGDAK